MELLLVGNAMVKFIKMEDTVALHQLILTIHLNKHLVEK